MKSHTIKTPLPQFGEDVFANWSTDPGTTAIIFIHGFHGHAIKTWVEFPTYVTTDVRFNKCDFFYYGYDSLGQQIHFSAAEFYQFIDQVYNNNHILFKESIGDSLGRHRQKIYYTNIIIVAHSMGAVITRKALVNAIKKKLIWVDKTKMILFAPAHRGARVSKLWIDSLPPVINIIANAISFKVVTIGELKPNSDTLNDLVASCKEYINTPYEPYVIAKEVVAASHDTIVYTLDFLKDPVPTPLKGSHTSVCKPKKGFVQPLDIVAKHL